MAATQDPRVQGTTAVFHNPVADNQVVAIDGNQKNVNEVTFLQDIGKGAKITATNVLGMDFSQKVDDVTINVRGYDKNNPNAETPHTGIKFSDGGIGKNVKIDAADFDVSLGADSPLGVKGTLFLPFFADSDNISVTADNIVSQRAIYQPKLLVANGSIELPAMPQRGTVVADKMKITGFFDPKKHPAIFANNLTVSRQELESRDGQMSNLLRLMQSNEGLLKFANDNFNFTTPIDASNLVNRKEDLQKAILKKYEDTHGDDKVELFLRSYKMNNHDDLPLNSYKTIEFNLTNDDDRSKASKYLGFEVKARKDAPQITTSQAEDPIREAFAQYLATKDEPMSSIPLAKPRGKIEAGIS